MSASEHFIGQGMDHTRVSCWHTPSLPTAEVGVSAAQVFLIRDGKDVRAHDALL